MSSKKPTARAEFVLFNVLYEDGAVTSNRKVPGSMLGGLDGDSLLAISLNPKIERSLSAQAGPAGASNPLPVRGAKPYA